MHKKRDAGNGKGTFSPSVDYWPASGLPEVII